MDTAHYIREYVEARGGKDTLSEEEKKALADMARCEERTALEQRRPEPDQTRTPTLRNSLTDQWTTHHPLEAGTTNLVTNCLDAGCQPRSCSRSNDRL